PMAVCATREGGVMEYLRAGRILRVNLTDGKIREEPVEPYVDRFIGSKGINVKILFDGVEPGIRPFDPDNLLLFGVGPLVATPFPGASRTDVMSKSPVTGALGDSSIGGYFGAELKFAGYDNLVVEGRADRPVYLYIRDNRVEIRDASAIWGHDTYETPTIVRKQLSDPSARVICIGPAGENLVLYASIMTPTGNAAGRTGLGAVMGSKNLKAIAVRGTRGIRIAEPREFLEECKKVRASIEQSPRYNELHSYGLTSAHDKGMRAVYELMGKMWKGAETISEKDFLKRHLYRRDGCFACPVACFQCYNIAGVGSGCVKCSPYGDLTWDIRNSNMLVFWETFIMCQRYGLDARSLANALAWLMELYENGIITAKDTDGIPMSYGNPEAILSMPKKISYREGIGDLLADGPVVAAKKIGKGAEDFLLVSKGLSTSTHVPAVKSWALAWAMSPTGEGAQAQTYLDIRVANLYTQEADIASFEERAEKYRERAEKAVGIRQAADPRVVEGKAALVRHSEQQADMADITGMCTWMTPVIAGLPVDVEMIANAMSIGLGTPVTVETLTNAGIRMRQVERAFGIRSGLSRGDDSVSKKFYQQLRPDGQIMAEIGVTEDELEEMKNDYYQLMGWDVETGVPTRETLMKLGLADVASVLQKRGH
ncbi:aldehyde ferredoxin oxidoreductase family protein, partial [Chloroflexota bacterium]